MAKKSGNYYISQAQNAGCPVKYGKGDHVKIYPPPTYTGDISLLICPQNLKGNGTEHSIIKTLLKWGIPIGIVLVVLYELPNICEYLNGI